MSTWGNLTVRDVRHNYVVAMSHKYTHVELPLIDAEFMAAFMSYETVERAARGCFDIRDDAYDDREWGELDSQERELYLCQARAALAAALGEDEDDE